MAEGRYMNPLTDYGFKKLFSDKEVMTAFLTDLLEPKSPIAEIQFLDKELTAQTKYERGIIYDLYCKAEDGSEFIVEMQNKSQLHFSDRILYYLSRSISTQENRGDDNWDYELRPVYGIFFLNFHLKGLKPLAVRTVQLKVNETGELFSDKLKAYTLELPDYKKMKEEDCKTRIDYWLYNLSNMETMTTQIPFQQQQPIFNKVGTIAELAHMTPEERIKYNISIDSFRTNLSVLKNERAEGIEEGLVKGRAEGRAEGQLLAAKNLKAMGILTLEQISAATSLAIEEIETL